jgi:hypothetical protein
MRDNFRLVERMRRCAHVFKMIERILDGGSRKRTMLELIVLADECGRMDPLLPPADRLARRSRAGLLCWFCENWALVAPLLHLQFERPMQDVVPAPLAPKAANLASEPMHPLSLGALLNH